MEETLSSLNPSIAVVVSTYNGADHIREQLDSVLSQDVSNVAQLSIYVRDDGSKDNTPSVLEEYENNGGITFIKGENLGVVGSFFDLISSVPKSIDYIALCDQDDIWHTDKLSRALRVLSARDSNVPQLYCSEYIFCDADMNPKGRSHLNLIGVDFPKMLFENMVSGNTTVINRALADAVVSAGRPGVYCHDWWLALVATAIGELAYDDFTSLDYRRTGSNVSPTGSDALKLLKYRFKTFFEKGQLSDISLQLEKLNDCFSNQMPDDKKRLLQTCLHGGRFAKAFLPMRLRQKPIEEIALRVLFLAGKL